MTPGPAGHTGNRLMTSNIVHCSCLSNTVILVLREKSIRFKYLYLMNSWLLAPITLLGTHSLQNVSGLFWEIPCICQDQKVYQLLVDRLKKWPTSKYQKAQPCEKANQFSYFQSVVFSLKFLTLFWNPFLLHISWGIHRDAAHFSMIPMVKTNPNLFLIL